MQRLAAVGALALVSAFAAPAFACTPHGAGMIFVFGLLLAPLLAIPYGAVGSLVLARNARCWFERPLKGWFLSSFFAWLAATVGAVVGFCIAALLQDLDVGSGALAGTFIFTTPLVFEVAYLMWIRSRAR